MLTVVLSVRVPANVYVGLERRAREEHQKLAQVVNEVLAEAAKPASGGAEKATMPSVAEAAELIPVGARTPAEEAIAGGK